MMFLFIMLWVAGFVTSFRHNEIPCYYTMSPRDLRRSSDVIITLHYVLNHYVWIIMFWITGSHDVVLTWWWLCYYVMSQLVLWRLDIIKTSYYVNSHCVSRRRFDVIMTWLIRYESAGVMTSFWRNNSIVITFKSGFVTIVALLL